MDSKRLEHRGKEVAASHESFFRDLTEECKREFDEQSNRVAETLRQTIEKLESDAAARDSGVVGDVAAKLKALRGEVQSFGSERDAAFKKLTESSAGQALATIRDEVSTARHEITEEIAVANRATHDALVAMMKGLKK